MADHDGSIELVSFGQEYRDLSPVRETVPESAYLAYEAACAAGIPVLEIDVFEDCEVTDQDPDEMVLERGQDAAWSAANAYAGRLYNPDSDKRLQFWMWWLQVAVPEAWRSLPPKDWMRKGVH